MTENKIYILLQEFDNFFGKLYKFFKGGVYNHASIGINDNLNEFYSFRTKWGLCIEHPFNFKKVHKKNVPCVLLEIKVTDDKYNNLVDELNYYFKTREEYHYSFLSLFLGLIGVKHDFKNGYYCSRFVANLLDKSGIVQLQKHSSLYMPSDFFEEVSVVKFEGLAGEII